MPLPLEHPLAIPVQPKYNVPFAVHHRHCSAGITCQGCSQASLQSKFVNQENSTLLDVLCSIQFQ